MARRLAGRMTLGVAVAMMVVLASAGVTIAWYNSTYYCGLNSSLSGYTVPEGSGVTQYMNYCQTYTGYSRAADYFCCYSGAIGVSGSGYLGAGQSGTLAMGFNAGGPGVKTVTGFIVASNAVPTPSYYNGYSSNTLTVVGNPSTPGIAEDATGGGWSRVQTPHWTWSSGAAYGSITQYEVAPTWAGSFLTGGTAFQPTLPSGVWGVRVRAMNNVGVWSAWSGTVYAYIDVSPPTTSLSLSGTAGNAGWWRSDVTSTLSASDAHSGVESTTFNLDGTGNAAYGGPFAIRGDGTHSFTYSSTDRVGNVEAAQSAQVRIDATAPVTSITYTGAHVASGGVDYLTSGTQVSLPANDATSGVASTRGTLAGSTFAFTGPFSLSGADGARAFSASSTDVAGNVEPEQRATLFLDNTAPVSHVVAGNPSYVAGADIYVTDATPLTLSAADAGVGVGTRSFRVGGGAWQDLSSFALSGADGAYAVDSRSSDLLGNQEAPKTATFLLDDTAPVVSLATPAPDSLSVADKVLDVPLPDCAATPAPCAHPLLAKANRPALVVGGAQVVLTSDAKDPIVNAVASGMAKVVYDVDGIVLGAATSAPWSVTWDTTAERGGDRVLTATASDNLGNRASVSRHVLLVPATAGGAQATAAWAQATVLSSLPSPPELPSIPPQPPTLPTLPTVPGLPTIPGGPTVPGVPALPTLPQLPKLPSIPSVPSPTVPPKVPAVKPVFSVIVDPNKPSVHYKAGLDVDGQFIGDERTVGL